jgi:very-short-patch-repair endonuclease
MSPLQVVVAGMGGVARALELSRRGMGRGLVAQAVQDGELIKVRKGWYALPDLAEEVVHAARVGGALACVSAARHHGLWVPPVQQAIHVAVPASAARLRQPRDSRKRLSQDPAAVVVHWTNPRSRTVQAVPEAIALAVRCRGAETAFVLLESALNRRLLSRGELALLNAIAPEWFRDWSRLAGRTSESGTESLLKLMLLSLDLPFRQQVSFPDIGRVDFLLGDALAVEVDSKEHHSEPYKDRRRDALLSARGIRSLRFTYAQVVYQREQVEAAIVGAVVRGDLAG